VSKLLRSATKPAAFDAAIFLAELLGQLLLPAFLISAIGFAESIPAALTPTKN
jgi:hypothetical protein